MYFPKR